MNTRSLLALAALALASACNNDLTVPTPVSEPIPGSYIVTVADGISPQLVAADHGITPAYVYTDALHGFAAEMSDAKHAELLADVRVKSIEEDEIDVEDATQLNATWGIDRVDQRALPLSGSYTYASTGSGVTVYIIDTGILTTHLDFGGRAAEGTNTVDKAANPGDCNGHGTHVASTVGGTTYGIAKGVRLVSVRVLNCSGSGTNSGVIAGVDWVTHNHAVDAVANMSLGGGASSALDAAVQASIASGVTYVFAAGNENHDACSFSPARVPAGITVGATDLADNRSAFSNFGSCLDMFAPGANITAAWIGSKTATKTMSGTSMSAPHVAGVAALYLSLHPGAMPQEVRDALVNAATKGVVTTLGAASPNLLLFSNY